jgi:hypothetical protein
MPVTYEPIASTTLGSAASSVTFSTISGAYTDLVLIANLSNATTTNAYYRVGNSSVDSGNNYSETWLRGNGSAAASGGRTSNDAFLLFNADNISQDEWTTNIIHLQNYSNTTTNKTAIYRMNSAANFTYATVGLWRSNSAINIITIYSGGNFKSGSTFSLYGIKAV